MIFYYKLKRQSIDDENVQFRRPLRLGSYSVRKVSNGNKVILDNPEDYYSKYSLNEFKRTKSLDLKEGFEFMQSDDILLSDTAKLDEFLNWIIKNKHLFLLNNEMNRDGKLNSINTDFVSFRGVFSLIMNLSYDFATEFTLHVEKFKGTHYLLLEKPQDKESKLISCYAGHRFEMYMTEEFSESDKLYMNPSRSKNDQQIKEKIGNKYQDYISSQLCFVYRSRLNGLSLCYGAEMDAFENIVKMSGPINSDEIKGVEMKTSRKLIDEKQKRNFCKFKSLKWYTQSYLTNVQKLSVGYWDNDLIVGEIKEYTLNDLIRYGESFWNPNHCLNQMNSILKFINDCFLKTNKNLLKFTYKKFTYQIVCEDSNVLTVLPDFYRNEFSLVSH